MRCLGYDTLATWPTSTEPRPLGENTVETLTPNKWRHPNRGHLTALVGTV